MPSFDRLFAGDGVVDVLMNLVPDKAVQAVFLGESINLVVAMLPCPSNKIVGDSDVQRAVRPIREDVDIVLAMHGGKTAWITPGMTQMNWAPGHCRKSGARGDTTVPAYAGMTT